MADKKDKYAKFKEAQKRGDAIAFRANAGDKWEVVTEPTWNAPLRCYKVIQLNGRSAVPKGGDDNVMTPESLAYAIVEYFEPKGSINDPCGGERAFPIAFEQYAKNTLHKLPFEIHESDIRANTASGKKTPA